MDFSQKKLSKKEWEAIEVPPHQDELVILKLIYEGYHDVNIKNKNGVSLVTFMKINKNIEFYHHYFYDIYFKKRIGKYISKYNFPPYTKVKGKKIKLKMADKIRIENSNRKLDTIKDTIYEFVLLGLVEKLGKKKRPFYYYTLHHLIKNAIEHINKYVLEFIQNILTVYSHGIKSKYIIKRAHEYMEKNIIVRKWQNMELYSHQKQLFTHCKNPAPKLVLYQAPTGTGKTISPIGLSQGHKLIFVCAAKHVGLQLAKSCVALELCIAIAFGCSDAGDIKLHYYAAKDFVKNRRTGGIFRVDNSVGDKVEIIISDIQSYLPAMRYMLAFNKKEDIIWYWDEPTITLDYETHPYHEILKKNWQENEIPNIVLSSATLPSLESIMPCIQYHKVKFRNAEIYSISSYDCKKTIPIINSEGSPILPHYCYADFDDIVSCATHIKKNKTILRHFDSKEIIRFILYVNKHVKLKDQLKIENYFENPIDIDIISIKKYYLELLFSIGSDYESIYQHFQEKKVDKVPSGIRITTRDAHTLTDGPTIFLAENVERIGKFCVESASIPDQELDNILHYLKINDKIYKQIKSLQEQQEIETKDNQKTIIDKEIQNLYEKIRPVRLERTYIPNSFSHLRKWASEDIKNAFTSDISEDDVERIVSLPILDIWKILLLMGIGVFKNHDCVFYSELMKKLATEQKLYLIIASTDYIYGTNYQFCHGYLGKDLRDMTQEKIIQAFGRIGRANATSNYSIRLRDDTMIDKVLKPCTHKPEVVNMNRLFGIK